MKSTIQKILVLISCLGAMACSEVSFSPSENLSKTETPPSENGKITESFYFNNGQTHKSVDVLFVVDNSGSMLEEQEKLGQRLSSFIASLSAVDWQIGITTTDTSAGTYGIKGSLVTLFGSSERILKPTSPNYANTFMHSVVRRESIDCQNSGVCPTNNEEPLRAIQLAIDKRNSNNAGFFRDNADLAVVILSDEDEMSSGPPEATKPSEVLAHFNSVWGSSKKISVYGIIVEPGDSACYNEQYLTAGTYGYHAAELAALTGGVTGSICDTDYSDNLSKIGENVNKLLNYVVLANDPDTQDLDLVISPYDPHLTWSIEGRRITFNKAPAQGTRVDVVYAKASEKSETLD